MPGFRRTAPSPGVPPEGYQRAACRPCSGAAAALVYIAAFAPDDYLIFGRETAGLPKPLLEKHPENWLRIPMFNPESRSLNLSNCVALVLFEALRQQGFDGEIQ